MVKPRTVFFILSVLIIIAFGGIVLFQSPSHQTSLQVFPATVNRDCAPWDGGAFTVAIQYDTDKTIMVSIWRSPDIRFPSRFMLPDEEGQVGNASIMTEDGPFVQLGGEVSFQSVSRDEAVEGGFSFRSGRGELFEGSFKAEWGDEVIFCG